VHNPDLRETLGWPEAQYEEVKAELAARRIGAQLEIATARPRGFRSTARERPAMLRAALLRR
jgi:hypothetical protein